MKLISATVLLFGIACAPAQADTQKTGTNAPWYEVEVIVFDRPDVAGQSIRERDLPPPLAARPLLPAAGAAPRPEPFQSLAAPELKLAAQAKKLATSREYSVLLHTGWRQPLADQAQADAAEIVHTSRDGAPRRLYGTLTLSGRQGLALAPDMIYGRAESNGASANMRGYRLQEVRRIKLGELHYFDHPLFGVLAVVRPYKPPQPAPAAKPPSSP